MTEDEARSLARRIIETWPNGAKGYVWAEALKGLDYEHAMDAYRSLRGDAVRTPVVGELVALYRQERARHRAAQPTPKAYDDGHDGPLMSMGEYLDLQARRADKGDGEAVKNLASWQRAMTALPTIIPMNRSTA